MTITVDISHADLADLLARIEAGEEIILSRGDIPVAKLAAYKAVLETPDLVETILRERANRLPVTQEEIAEWKQIGRR